MAKSYDLPVKKEVKEVELIVQEVETNSIIVKVDGWRMRVHFEENVTIAKPFVGQLVKVKYTGNIENVHSVRFEKLK